VPITETLKAHGEKLSNIEAFQRSIEQANLINRLKDLEDSTNRRLKRLEDEAEPRLKAAAAAAAAAARFAA
jgi:hypothetical protein